MNKIGRWELSKSACNIKKRSKRKKILFIVGGKRYECAKINEKSLEAVEAAQNYSRELENMQIEQIHLFWALVQDQEGLIPQLLIKMNLDPKQILAVAETEAKKLPGVSGPGREMDKIYISQNLDRALTAAEKKADSMKDDYISVEHLFWGLLEHPDATVKSSRSMPH